jgi:uncharacterized protein (DUF302 family)
VFLLIIASFSFAAQGVIIHPSPYAVTTTADRLENLLQKKGMTLFNRIGHSDAAREVGVDLRPTELLIFGNPKVGSPLMQCSQEAAIDLPQKALVWEDEAGQTFLSYNDPIYLKERHQIKGCNQVLEKISKALANFAKGATSP